MHILHHAEKGDLYGLWMIEELAEHGYAISAGTLYPMLHGLEHKGYLRSHKKRVGRTYRRFYRATPKGRRALLIVRARLRELFDEVGGKTRRAEKTLDGSGTSHRAGKRHKQDRSTA